MGRRRILLLLGVSFCLPAPPCRAQPSAEDKARVVEKAREYALGYMKSLPDFFCTQVTRRYVRAGRSGRWDLLDVVTARLTYFEGKEEYAQLLVDGHALPDVPILLLEGATSSGEFGRMMAAVFAPESRATFRWERWDTVRGRPAHVYSYHVARVWSKWHVFYDRKVYAVPGYHGLVYVDRDLLAVTRITLVPELPAGFQIQQAQTALDYNFVTISGREYLLPLKAVVRMRHGKRLSKNEVEFSSYRKFSAESTLDFEKELPAQETGEEPPK